MSPLAALYRLIMDSATPLLRVWLGWRLSRGKELPERVGEKQAQIALTRPEGRLIWLHAASLGEMLSLLSLIRRLLQANPSATVLLTTVTAGSARVIAQRIAGAPPDDPIGRRLLHQFLPLDRSAWGRAFLDHWRPDIAIWVESELWPTLLREVKARDIPLALLNGRLSSRSAGRWAFARGWIGRLLGGFDPLLAQSEGDRQRLVALGGRQAEYLGNLKLAGDPLPASPSAADLAAALGDRPRWLLASSHPGEDATAFAVHRSLLKDRIDFLTVIAPRHPDRAERIEQMAQRQGFAVGRRSRGELPARWQDVYLADTLGEMGTLYRHCPVVCIGGSLIRRGGHNPFEPVQLGCCVLHGPHMDNFAELILALDHAGAARLCESTEELATAVGVLVDNPDSARAMQQAAAAFVAGQADVLDRVLERLAPTLQRAGLAVR